MFDFGIYCNLYFFPVFLASVVIYGGIIFGSKNLSYILTHAVWLIPRLAYLCNDTAFLSSFVVEDCLSDSFSKYLILSLTIAFAASVFKVGILSLCLGSMAGRFIECSNFSAASCTSDYGLKTSKDWSCLSAHSLHNWSYFCARSCV